MRVAEEIAHATALTRRRVDEGEERLLHPETVLRLVEDDRLGSVDDGVGDLLTAVRGQAVHDADARRGQRHERVVDLQIREILAPALLFRLLAHARPNVRVDDFGIAQCRRGVVRDLESGAFGARSRRGLLDDVRAWLVAARTHTRRCTPSSAAA